MASASGRLKLSQVNAFVTAFQPQVEQVQGRRTHAKAMQKPAASIVQRNVQLGRSGISKSKPFGHLVESRSRDSSLYSAGAFGRPIVNSASQIATDSNISRLHLASPSAWCFSGFGRSPLPSREEKPLESQSEGCSVAEKRHHATGFCSSGRRSRSIVCSATEGSPGFGPIIEQEAFELSKLFSTLGPLLTKYRDFDLEGKKIFCAQMEMFLDKLQVFTTR